MIQELRYSNTNTYFIRGSRGALLFDTGWAGTFPGLCRCLGEHRLRLQDIRLIVLSHFHPDHMGIAQEAADAAGAEIAVMDIQAGSLHSADGIFAKEDRRDFVPIDDSRVRVVTAGESPELLGELGIKGELIPSPGHSEDSISLWLRKERALFVGDLPPLYELEMHRDDEVGRTWERLLALGPRRVYYGHAKAAELGRKAFRSAQPSDPDIYGQVRQITKLIDKGVPLEEICRRTGAGQVFVQDVTRMYLTHPGVSVQGILDRIEIKGR